MDLDCDKTKKSHLLIQIKKMVKIYFSSHPSRVVATVSLFFVVVILFSLFNSHGEQFQNVVKFSPYDPTGLSFTGRNPSSLKILIGILTHPDHYDRRRIIRMAYGVQKPPKYAHIDVKFVFCNLTTDAQKLFVSLEIMNYDDIIILNCTENMDNGKTYSYFSSLPAMLGSTNSQNHPYDYVMKTDDDTYFRIDKLVESLMPLPREDLYYGAVVPCRSYDVHYTYMSGMGYALSWDLVYWISYSEIVKKHTEGPEDRLVSEWLNAGLRGKHRYNAKPNMYDFPNYPNSCSHEFVPETIAVHYVKSPEKWAEALRYFNATNGLKPSKLYHID